jgi:hypothetical protein
MVLRLRRADRSLAIVATGRVAFPNGNRVERPDSAFSKLNRLAHWYPYLRFD